LQALEIIPYTLAENSGINPIAMVTELRNRHNQGEFGGGINVRNGTITDMWAEKIVQPLLVNTSEIQLATECVGMILKIGTFSVDCFCRRSFPIQYISFRCSVNVFFFKN
jgi:T-complex protein 1 subunit delta